MKLYIDTSNSEKIVVGLDSTRMASKSREEKAQKLLSVIDNLLKKKNIDIHKITAIKVNTGPGSFTGLRVGVSVANTLGWALEVPVNSKRVDKTSLEPIY